MEADLYKIYETKEFYDNYDDYQEIESECFFTTDKRVVESLKGQGYKIAKYVDFTNISNPCSMAYYNKMKHEKDKLIDDMQSQLSEQAKRYDARILALNKRIIELMKG